MAKPLPLKLHPISYVKTLRARGMEQRGYVACSRHGGSVATSVCAECPRFVKVAQGTFAGDRDVHCEQDPVAARRGAGPKTGLTGIAVASLMNRDVLCVEPTLSLRTVASLFLKSGLKSLPVVRPDGSLLGAISSTEVLLAIHTLPRASGSTEPTVGDLMLPSAPSLAETASVTEAAAVMAYEGEQQVTVVAASGAVVGVLSASDVLYLLARSEGHVMPRSRDRTSGVFPTHRKAVSDEVCSAFAQTNAACAK